MKSGKWVNSVHRWYTLEIGAGTSILSSNTRRLPVVWSTGVACVMWLLLVFSAAISSISARQGVPHAAYQVPIVGTGFATGFALPAESCARRVLCRWHHVWATRRH